MYCGCELLAFHMVEGTISHHLYMTGFWEIHNVIPHTMWLVFDKIHIWSLAIMIANNLSHCCLSLLTSSAFGGNVPFDNIRSTTHTKALKVLQYVNVVPNVDGPSNNDSTIQFKHLISFKKQKVILLTTYSVIRLKFNFRRI